MQLGGTAQEAIVHRSFAEGQGRVVADLLQPGEQGQHLAVALAAWGTGDGIEGVFDRFAVKGFLLLAQSHPFAQFHLFG